MEHKKSKSANLNKSRKAFFMIGLAVASSFVLMAFEWNTITYKSEMESQVTESPYDIPFTQPEEIEIIRPEQPQPKKVEKFNQEEVIVTEDIVEKVTEEVEEKKVDFKTLLDQLKMDNPNDSRKTSFVDQGELDNDDEPVNMGPSIKVPYYDYCAEQSYEEKIACISKEIHKSIGDGMSNVTAYQIETNKKSKMYVQFVIGKEGLIEDLKIAGEENFNKAIVKMVKKSMTEVPQMHPALLNGKPVRVYFSIPINFNVQ